VKPTRGQWPSAARVPPVSSSRAGALAARCAGRYAFGYCCT